MNAKERKQEEQELKQAVKVLGATIRCMAKKKARRYELEFLHQVRDMIDAEINTTTTVDDWIAESTGREVSKELSK